MPFQSINRAYDSVFRPGKLSLGVVVPIESYPQSPVPTMERHLERVRLVEELGFGAVWLRDVPFNVPSFGDAGQTFDPFVYLGLLAGCTDRIALGVASIVLPLRHPAHVAKAAASVDVLSGGRLILGVASGDRPQEYPALGLPFEDREARFRSAYDYIRAMSGDFPAQENEYGVTRGDVDLLPKPTASKLPLLITGSSRQSPDWLARNGDGWMVYPRNLNVQAQVIEAWRSRLQEAGEPNKPVLQPLYVDLADDSDSPPRPIHLGFRMGAKQLVAYLKALEHLGVNHVALNLRFNTTTPQQKNIEQTLERLADEVLPHFSET